MFRTSSPVAADHFSALRRTDGPPRQKTDRVGDEPDAAITHRHAHAIGVSAAGYLHPRTRGRGGGGAGSVRRRAVTSRSGQDVRVGTVRQTVGGVPRRSTPPGEATVVAPALPLTDFRRHHRIASSVDDFGDLSGPACFPLGWVAGGVISR